MPDPPPGYVTKITLEHLGGVGSWNPPGAERHESDRARSSFLIMTSPRLGSLTGLS